MTVTRTAHCCQCGKEFQTKRGDRPPAYWCSVKCGVKAAKTRRTGGPDVRLKVFRPYSFECRFCGLVCNVTTPDDRRRAFCSDGCGQFWWSLSPRTRLGWKGFESWAERYPSRAALRAAKEAQP